MNEKIKAVGEAEGEVIMEFKEMIDGNFMMILNGGKLKERAESGDLAIDLNGLITGEKLTPIVVLLSHKIKNFMRGALPEVIKKEILELDSNGKRINSFVKKYGFEAIEILAVKNYFRELVKKARDKKELKEGDACKKKLQQLIVAMCHRDQKVRIVRDVSSPDLIRYLEKIETDANMFYPIATKYCWDYEGKKGSYSKCKKKVECVDLIDHLKENLADWSQKKIDDCLKLNTPSEYIAETFRLKLGVNRPLSEEFLRHVRQMRKLT